MTRILLLGSTGMLGHEIYKTLREKYDVLATDRTQFNADILMDNYAHKDGTYFRDFVKRIGNVDCVINAIGITIPYAMHDPAKTFFVNSALPHILAREYGSRLIHITTDCVYSGIDGDAPYSELSGLSPKDIYGLSKSLGEPENCLTIRTSIIGRELRGHNGLLEWFFYAAKTGIPIEGYTDHLWSGITTHQFALICDKIIEGRGSLWPWTGLFHVFSDSISKYDMLVAFKKHFDVSCDIRPVSGRPVDRRLTTCKWFNYSLNIPTFQQMLEEMA